MFVFLTLKYMKPVNNEHPWETRKSRLFRKVASIARLTDSMMSTYYVVFIRRVISVRRWLLPKIDCNSRKTVVFLVCLMVTVTVQTDFGNISETGMYIILNNENKETWNLIEMTMVHCFAFCQY